jgi:hypothetical protein
MRARRTPGGRFEFAGVDQGDRETRLRFLRLVTELAPEVRRVLDVQVAPLFRPTALATGVVPDWLALKKADERSTVGPLRRALVQWGERFRLDADWVYETALLTLANAQTHPHDAWTLAAAPKGSPFSADEIRFNLDVAGWNPARVGRGEAKRAITRLFEDACDRHLDAVERLARARGGIERPASRRRRRPLDPDDEIRAFVMWQVLGRTKTAIRRSLRLKRTELNASLARTSRALGIDLFVGKAGRPETAPPVAISHEDKSISGLAWRA